MKRLQSKFRVPNFLKREDGDLLKIEHSLIKTMSELRDKELRSISLSEEFSIRLKNQLQQIQPEPLKSWELFREGIFVNRGLQYSFSAILAFALIFVTYNRFQTSNTPVQGDRSGTVFGQAEVGNFQDIPSSGKFQSELDEIYLKQIPSNVEAKKTLDFLQRYFSEKGDLRTSEELSRILELTQSK
ncbi:hypothetical protein AB3N59_06305 [Leptospira sp. WS92.C1]